MNDDGKCKSSDSSKDEEVAEGVHAFLGLVEKEGVHEDEKKDENKLLAWHYLR